jgi:membrane associated rhomboid family serine protease/Zn-finger nucleic acid-binding protein
MLPCPRCSLRLKAVRSAAGISWGCPRCGGAAVAMPVLRSKIVAEALRRVWGAAVESPAGDLRCPSCSRAMLRRAPAIDGGDIALDLCRPCQLVWFDPGEIERLPRVPPSPPAKELSQSARESLAMVKLGLDLERREFESTLAPPDSTWKQVAAALGLPVDAEESELGSRPWATWSLALAIAVASVLALFRGGEDVFERLGFVADAPRWPTLTTHALLHGGIVHLALNLYFLVLFGDDVEEIAGRPGFLALFASAVLAGAFAHAAWTATPELPLIGASGGIAGLIAWDALNRPRARMAVCWYGRVWLRIPLWGWAAIWVGGQALGALSTHSSVSYGAHLGGALAGVLAWGAWKLLAPRSDSTPDRGRSGLHRARPSRGMPPQ